MYLSIYLHLSQVDTIHFQVKSYSQTSWQRDTEVGNQACYLLGAIFNTVYIDKNRQTSNLI